MRIQPLRQALGDSGRADIVSNVTFEVRGTLSEGAEAFWKDLTGVLAGEEKR